MESQKRPNLQQKVNPKTGKREWCLMSKDGKRALQYLGVDKPSDEVVAKAVARIEKYSKPRWKP